VSSAPSPRPARAVCLCTAPWVATVRV
jgi:hypothetical protein